MKRANYIVCMMLVIIVLSGCSKEKIQYTDTYIPKQDMQYMHYGNFGINTVETEKGYYKLVNQFLYFIDKETMTTVPLCDKAECLHEQDTSGKKTECNAYAGYNNIGQLFYDGNFLYVLRDVYHKDDSDTYITELWRISMDGTTKDKVCGLPKEEEVFSWMLHRGSVYYVTEKEGEDGKIHKVLKYFQLKDTDNIKTIKMFDDIYNGCVQDIQAYGNYVYLYLTGNNKDIESGETDIEDDETEDFSETIVNRWVCYNIVTSEMKELFTDQTEDGKMTKMVQYIDFWQDKLLAKYFYLDEKAQKSEEAGQIYQYQLDGSQKEILLQTDDQYDKYRADENYLYVYNFWRKSVDAGKEKPKMTVYDKQGNQVDEMEMPMNAYADMEGGSSGCFLWDMLTEEKMEIVYIDKSKIGTYHGKKMEAIGCYEAKVNMEFDEKAEE